MIDFDRAKRGADGITRFDARVRTLLMIAAHALRFLDEDVSDGGGIVEHLAECCNLRKFPRPTG
jgi:hypothetical protein